MLLEIELPDNIQALLCKANMLSCGSIPEAAKALVSCHNWRKVYNVHRLSESELYLLSEYRQQILMSIKNKSAQTFVL
jgi:hypothetical protein